MRQKFALAIATMLCAMVVGCNGIGESTPSGHAHALPTTSNGVSTVARTTDTNPSASNSTGTQTTQPSPSSGNKATSDGSFATGSTQTHTNQAPGGQFKGTIAVKQHPQKKSAHVTPIVLSIGSQGPEVQKLQEWLATTGYLPLVWTPPKSGANGRWKWTYASTPKSLQSLWSPTKYTLLTKSAVMTFEQVHHLPVDGIAGPQVFAALSSDVSHHHRNPVGFTYVQVSLRLSQTLTLWHNGRVVLKSLANSGIPQSPTAKGTYPVYLQYRSQTMSGTTPSGQHYKDPGIPYVSYFHGGDAVHGFVRAHYGYPQSLGCVELPIPAAKEAWPYIHLGTLVHVF